VWTIVVVNEPDERADLVSNAAEKREQIRIISQLLVGHVRLVDGADPDCSADGSCLLMRVCSCDGRLKTARAAMPLLVAWSHKEVITSLKVGIGCVSGLPRSARSRWDQMSVVTCGCQSRSSACRIFNSDNDAAQTYEPLRRLRVPVYQ
jgi:hypothetical protein